MNVASGGLGGGTIMILFGLMPLVVILILINLRVLSKLDRAVKWGAIIAIYLLSFFIQYGATFILRTRFLDVFGYFSIYLLFLLFLSYAFKNIQGASVKRPLLFVSIITALVLSMILILTKPKAIASNALFVKQFEQALDLKLLAIDSLYSATALVIKSDTIAGYYDEPQNESYKENPFKCFYIQSLKNFKYKKIINVTGWIGSAYSVNYANGGIYVDGTKNGNLARAIYADTTEIEGFRDSLMNDGLVGGRMIYKNMLIIAGGNSFIVFDSATEKKLFGKRNAQYFKLINNCLIFTSAAHDTLTVSCLDLDKLKIRWINRFPAIKNEFSESLRYPYDELKGIIATSAELITDKGVLIFDLNTGIVKNIVPLPTVSDRGYYFQSDKENDYISTDSVLQCRSHEGKEKWRLSGMRLFGIFNDRLIALTQDARKYLILNKDNGQVMASVADPGPQYRVRVYGKYLIVDTNGEGRLYK